MKFTEKVKGLDPQVAANALVGFYMQSFAAVEMSLIDCIQNSLRLTNTQRYIVESNLSFRSKINIMKTLNSFRPVTTHDKDETLKLIERAAGHSKDRNMVAHSLFGEEQSKKGKPLVFFLRTSAKDLAHEIEVTEEMINESVIEAILKAPRDQG